MSSQEKIAIPDGLSRKGRKAAEAILAVLRKHEMMDTGGCDTFYSPKAWLARGEQYGTNAELIVVYDGGAVRSFFEWEGYDHTLIEEMSAAIDGAGCWSEKCTCWYSAVYPK